MPARVTSAAFVGRGPQLAELEGALATMREGKASLVFVAGESGVGKTRLLDEFVDAARVAGARVLWGDCVELGDRELPYAPIVAALRQLARSGDPVLDELGPAREELALLVPELGEGRAWRVEEMAGSPQGRVFELLLGLFARVAQEGPLVIVLEDLHWADASTRDFLSYWARNMCAERILVVGSYRLDELHRRHPLRPLLAEIERSDRARRLTVERFTRDELAEQLHGILDDEPGPELLDRLFSRTEGNALFTEELLAAGRDGDGTLPDSLRDALMLRVEMLPESAQEVLRWVATAQRIDHDVLAEVSGIPARELRDALRQCVTHHVLVALEDGRFSFRHALLREVVEDDLLPGEGTEMHLALARALDRRVAAGEGSLGRATAVAHHFDEAGDQPEALRTLVRAGARAAEAMALGEASSLYERALQLWERVPDPEAVAGIDHVELLKRASFAHDANPGRSLELIKAALQEVDRDRDREGTARLLERLGRSWLDLGRGDAAMDAWDDALALLPARPPTETRARVLAHKALGLMLGWRMAEADALAQEALADGRAVGSRFVQMHALNTMGTARLSTTGVDEAVELLRRSIVMAREDGELGQLNRGYNNLSDVLHLAGRTLEAYALLEAAAAEPNAGRRSEWLIFQRAEMAFYLGLWDEADALLSPENAPRYPGTSMIFFEIQRAQLEQARGDHEPARERLLRAGALAERSFEPQWHTPIAAVLAGLERRERRLDAARAALETGFSKVTPAGITSSVNLVRLLAGAAGVEADAAEQARALGRPDEEHAAVEAATHYAEKARRTAADPDARDMPETRAWALVAEAEAAAARGTPAPELHAEAADAWAALERPYRVARSRWKQAEALVARDDRAAAAPALREAHAIAVQLGARWLRDETASLARRARLRLDDAPVPVPDDAPEADAAPDAGDALGLTPREREVLALVAEGATNREIGERLFMAEKTASVHVSRILAKLDVRSRTQAAAAAHRLGLTDGDGLAAAG